MTVAAQSLPSGYFLTEVRTRRQVADFLVTETSYTSNQRLPKHSHERAGFSLVVNGPFTESYGSRTLWCKSGDVIFRPSDEVHSERFGKTGGRCLTVELTDKWMERARAYSVRLNSSAALQNEFLSAVVSRLYNEFLERDEVSIIALEGYILEMIAKFARSPLDAVNHMPPQRIEQAREMIQAHFAEKLTLSQIAETVNLHPVYLARQFRKQYRCTVGEYIRRERIRLACQQLAHSDVPLAQISLAAGFCDQSHFSKAFMRLTGLTPSKYRQTHRSG